MKLPVYELKINESLADDSEVTYVALVDEPAIQKDFLAFKDEFVDPRAGESEDEFIGRCVKYVMNEGTDQEQALAICYSKWEKKFAADSYNDYPEAAVENAKTALRWAEENGWGDCGESTGKLRANQISKRENLTRETIARMASFERHRQNSDRPLGEGCGRLMWLAWGGDEGIAWAQRKLKQIDAEKMAFSGISFDYDDTLSTERGQKLAAEKIKAGAEVYIISARHDKEPMMRIAQKLGIPASHVFATGSNKAKVEKVKELGITKHYDNNADVVKELGGKGEKFQMGFSIMDEDKRIISGPLMLADELIYRNNDKFGEHYVKFTAETIKAIAIKFAKRKYQANVNLMHDPDQKVQDVTMFESWIVDKERGILPMKGFEDVANGSWFGSFYVENDEVWKRVKEGEYRGFSVEGLFDYEQPKSYEEQMLEKIKNLLYS